MRKNLVAANWKMHGSKAEVAKLLNAIKQGINSVSCDVVICPPSLFLEQAQRELAGTDIALGAQNAHSQDEGAFTGEISFAMLNEFSCTYAIVGHSERRQLFGESDELIAEKFSAAQRCGLRPILCVGESQEQREKGETRAVVLGQLEAVRKSAGIDAFAQAVIAYEPIWAIGSGLSATPEQAQEVHATIRAFLAESDKTIAANMTILYGGSVKAANADSLFVQADIDGALVGGASLDAKEFLTICTAAA
tara:strand:- start:336 stop:1085 length:750 start_codon:yes stop_codon:yes gene_type:complete